MKSFHFGSLEVILGLSSRGFRLYILWNTKNYKQYDILILKLGFQEYIT